MVTLMKLLLIKMLQVVEQPDGIKMVILLRLQMLQRLEEHTRV